MTSYLTNLNVLNSSLWKKMIAWERSCAASAYGIIWGGRSSGHLELRPSTKVVVPLFQKLYGMTFFQIPRKESIRQEYVRLLRNNNLKLESDSTCVCSAGGKKLSTDHLQYKIKKKTERQILSHVPPNNLISACGVTLFPGYHSFPKWALNYQGLEFDNIPCSYFGIKLELACHRGLP